MTELDPVLAHAGGPHGMNLSEAEIQLLIALVELAEPVETPNNNFYTFYPKTLEEAAAYFRTYQEDWTPAYPVLEAKGLLENNGGTHCLTPAGLEQARQLRAARPPIWYFYQQYYTESAASRAYAAFCERAYGKHLCQTNFSDMAQLDRMVEVCGLGPGMRALDLGCGSGMIAEHLSAQTGAHITGVDYSPAAIRLARARTAGSPLLDFHTGNMDSLAFPPAAFDLIYSIDTLYMPANLERTLQRLVEMLAPGGQLVVFYSEFVWDPSASRSILQADGTTLAQAFRRLGLAYQSWDFSAGAYHLMQRRYAAGLEMKPDFEAEGTLFLYEHVMQESESSPAPYDPHTANTARYLYRVQV